MGKEEALTEIKELKLMTDNSRAIAFHDAMFLLTYVNVKLQKIEKEVLEIVEEPKIRKR